MTFPDRQPKTDSRPRRSAARLRTILFWAHLVCGVSVGLLVLLMSVTGVLLTYQRQITAWADVRGLEAGPPSAGAERLGVEALLMHLQTEAPAQPTSVRWYADPGRPVEVAFGRERTLFVNGYTGEVLGSGSAGVREFFRKVVAWHRWLGTEGEAERKTARSMTGAANLGFLFLVVSGFYLWWPRRWTWRALRNVTLFRPGLKPKARDFNWHNVLGFWSALPLLVVVASGVVISYPWASDLVYRSVGEAPPPRRAPGSGGGEGGSKPEGAPVIAGLDALAVKAEAQVAGWRSITLALEPASEVVSFGIDRGTGGEPHRRAQLVLEREGGAVAKWEPFSAGTRGRQLRSVLRFAHTGEVAGLAGQTLAGLVSAAAAVLVWTGLALAWRRLREWRGRRAGRRQRRSRAMARLLAGEPRAGDASLTKDYLAREAGGGHSDKVALPRGGT